METRVWIYLVIFCFVYKFDPDFPYEELIKLFYRTLLLQHTLISDIFQLGSFLISSFFFQFHPNENVVQSPGVNMLLLL